ncbi:hypothetical protein ONS95_003052 [Cadophora gregata]|uniref:uncharacterized protein n=2 Tax=Cadophora gregata TaxID=51156 RepID=UPI0026DBD6E1|nr:uncharacterized protein ONS95_003052 [Cadophora gregata]KAK0108232.1 hypothetical protein ONS95_003052 [Cadophora gregata]
MSDNMQNRRTREYKGSKFTEGRLKLSTSCGECHKRKQKCDQKQPCRHCARRYPQPDCIYRNIRDTSTTLKGASDEPSEPHAESRVASISGQQKDRFETETTSDSTISFSDDLVPAWLQVENDATKRDLSVSVETLDQFGPNTYQDLLSSMVSQISSSVLADPANSNAAVLGSSNKTRTELPAISYDRLSLYPRSPSGTPDQRSPHFDLVPSPHDMNISSVDPLHFLGITPTVQSSELLQAFLKLITKYVVSIDGHAAPNYYNDHWVPWSVKSPLLAYFGIFTAACYQAEALKISPNQSAVVLRYKCKVISLLNEMLSHKATSTSTEAIAAVLYLSVNEWYWSDWENIQAHMKGLKEMVRLRGGLDNLGMSDFPRRMILLMDYHIACSYSSDLTFPHDIKTPKIYPPQMSIPFIPPSATSTSNESDIQISKQTAMILNDMRFLMLAILNQVDRNVSAKEMQKLETTSIWIQNRISSLPDGSDPNDDISRDQIYKSLRLASLIYCKAIVSRRSLAKSCTLSDLNQLWANMWQVKLSRWKQIPGIFLFIILAATPAAQDTAHGRFLKSMLKTTSSYISMDYWEVADASLMAFVKLQRWLTNGGVDAVKVGQQTSLEFLHIYGE